MAILSKVKNFITSPGSPLQKAASFVNNKISKPLLNIPVSFVKDAMSPAGELLTEKVTKPLLKGELPAQRTIIKFLDEGRKAQAQEMVNKGYAKDIEDATQKLVIQDLTMGAISESGQVVKKVAPKIVEEGKGIIKSIEQKLSGTLTEEAKKYKSAEEFVKAQGGALYHGTNGDFKVFAPKTGKEELAGEAGTFFTTNQTEAFGFGKNIKETYISPNAKIKVEYASDMLPEIRAERIFKARREGYDAVMLKNIQPLRGNRAELSKLDNEIIKLKPEIDKLNQRMLDGEITPEQNLSDPLMKKWSTLLEQRNPTHTIVFNTNVIKTKSQLTDIWNEANKNLPSLPEKQVEVIKELLQAPKVNDGILYSTKKTFRKLFSSDALTKYGDEGKQIFNKIKDAEKYAILKKSESVMNLDDAFKTMTDQDFVDFGDMVEGTKPITETAKKAVQTWRGEAKHIANAAQKYGIQIKVPVTETIQKTDSSIPKTVMGSDLPSEYLQFGNSTMEDNYQTFKMLISDERLRNLKAREAVTSGDLESFRKTAIERKLLSSKEVDNLTYSQEYTGDEVLDLFKERLKAEDPSLFMGKSVAENLGYEAKNPLNQVETRTVIKKIPFTPKENYYPYFVREDKLKEILQSQDKYTEFLKQVAEKSKVTVAKAHELISDMINGRASVYGHLEKAREARLPKEFYERDPRKILSQYISDAWDRLGDAKFFGGDDSTLQNLIEKARVKGEDFEEIQDLVERALGREKFNKAITQVSSFARTYNNLTKLSLSAVTNLGDITKTFTRSGFFPTLKGIIQSFSKKGVDFAAQSGVTNPVLKQFVSEQGGEGVLSKINEKFFRLTGFQGVETKLRQISANAGKNYVESLFNKLKKNPNNSFIRRRLEQFGLNADELLQKGLKPSDLVEAGYQAIADTQPISRVDLPYYWQSPTGKMLTQYKTFAYKQMKFAKDFMFKEATKGNIKPLLTFLLVGTAIGEGVGDLKAFVRNRERPDTLGQRVIDDLMTIGGVGLATDFLSNLQYNTMGGGLLKFVVGPTLSDMDAWLTAIQGDISVIADKKKKFAELGEKTKKNRIQPKVLKKTISSLPFLGPAVSNGLFPTRNKYKARTIPIAEEILNLLEGND